MGGQTIVEIGTNIVVTSWYSIHCSSQIHRFNCNVQRDRQTNALKVSIISKKHADVLNLNIKDVLT